LPLQARRGAKAGAYDEIEREEALMAERIRQIVSEVLQKGLRTPETSPLRRRRQYLL